MTGFLLKAKQSHIQNQLESRLSTKENELEEANESKMQAVAAANEKLKQSQDKMEDLNKQLDNALSAKLELDAKVESTSDELRYSWYYKNAVYFHYKNFSQYKLNGMIRWLTHSFYI